MVFAGVHFDGETFPCFLDGRKYDFEIDFSSAVSVCPCLIF